MSFIVELVLKLTATVALSYAITPLIKKVACKINAVDHPNERRINTIPMPSAGGLGIYLTFSIALLLFFPKDIIPWGFSIHLIVASGIIVLTGLIDDIYALRPRQKLVGMIVAAMYAYFVAGIKMDTVNLFSFTNIDLGFLSFPMTIIWILALTNAINLIDGLDGLASGVSIIALTSIGIVGYLSTSSGAVMIQVPITIFLLVASILGFLPRNFFPAKIFLGDTGALFLGFMIAVLSLQGLKNATFVSLITPLIILGVPITDTLFAIIRRTLNKQPISSADHMHLHHRLLSIGFTHRGAVLMIYALALIFSLIAILYSFASGLANWIMIVATIFGLQLFVELIGLTGSKHQPLISCLKFIGNRAYRNQILTEKKEKSEK